MQTKMTPELAIQMIKRRPLIKVSERTLVAEQVQKLLDAVIFLEARLLELESDEENGLVRAYIEKKELELSSVPKLEEGLVHDRR